jgi:alcohol dehydrogenase class IV
VTLMRGTFRNSFQRTVRFGAGSVDEIGELVNEIGSKAPFIVASRSLSRKTKIVDTISDVLGGRLAGLFDQTVAHVPQRTVLEATEAARKAGADLFISVGGGSVSDLTKMMSLSISKDIRDASGFDAARVHYEPGQAPVIPGVENELIPTIAVATTLSAAEFSGFAGVTDEVRKCKDLFVDDKLTPYGVILDAELLKATPDWLLLSSGIRAVDHCIEVMLSSTAQVFTNSLSSDALQRMVTYLPRLKDNGRNVDDVTQCQLACWESLFALANVLLGLSHGLGHQLGARCGVPHGYTSCVMLPHVMDFNLDVTEEAQATIARLMGVRTEIMTTAEAARAAAPAVLNFIRSLGLPTTLKEVGVGPEDLQGIADDAMLDLVVSTNPRSVESTDQVVEILRGALGD